MRKVLQVVALAAAMLIVVAAPSASASPIPSGERILGRTVIEPVYDDMTGAIRYVSTPMGVPDPVKSNPRAAAPFYLPVYPTGANVGTLVCQDVPVENCPDHGAAVAGAAMGIMPNVYGAGVIGHDHLMAGPASHGDFNVAWVPTLVLFTDTKFVTHITTLAEITQMAQAGEVITVPLDGTNGTPNLTFHCSVVPAAPYLRGTPWTS
ncbi:MAG TPA: hypothetical protein VFL67_02665 [Mycobacterium sp.]|nr:hypothetical protein [Mycobacterium sp.]